jgi:hypothetical protein
MKKTYALSFLLFFPLLLAFQGCEFTQFEPSGIIVTAESVRIAWDPPGINNDTQVPVAAYKVYYRLHGMVYWTLLDLIPAEQNPGYTVYHKELGNGSYDIAVQSVSSDVHESNLHSSLDLDADPLGGWYIIWLRFENEQ